jgi:hypothetical protein
MLVRLSQSSDHLIRFGAIQMDFFEAGLEAAGGI